MHSLRVVRRLAIAVRPLPVVAVVLAAPILAAPSAGAQEEEPQTHVITVTTFKVPFTALDDFWQVIDKYVVPSDKANPHIISSRIAGHNWGDSNQTVWFISEYESLAKIEESEEWADKNFDKQYPEGSAQRDSADAAFEEHFLTHFSGHVDNILSVNLNRAK